MNIEQLQSLLPCYVCGDLPPEVEGRVREAISADPGLAQQVDALALSREECRRALRAAEAALPSLELSAPPHRWRALPWAVGVVTVVFAGAIASHLWAPSEGVPVGVAVERSSVSLRSTDPAMLSAMLRERGVDPVLSRVADLSSIGLVLVGGAPLSGGALIFYEHDGVEVRCQLSRDAIITAEPASRVRHGGVSVALGQAEGRAWAQWSRDGVVTLCSAPMPASDLLTLIDARLDLESATPDP